jgi:hypothetical protein
VLVTGFAARPWGEQQPTASAAGSLADNGISGKQTSVTAECGTSESDLKTAELLVEVALAEGTERGEVSEFEVTYTSGGATKKMHVGMGIILTTEPIPEDESPDSE